MADALTLTAENEAVWRELANAAQTQDTEAALFVGFDAVELRRLFAEMRAAFATIDAARAVAREAQECCKRRGEWEAPLDLVQRCRAAEHVCDLLVQIDAIGEAGEDVTGDDHRRVREALAKWVALRPVTW